MKTRLPLKTRFSAELISHPAVKSIIPIGSWWEFEQWRKGKLIDRWAQKNVNTTEGLNYFLNVMFFDETPIASTGWFMGLFEDDYTPLIADSYASPGFTESEAYDELTRILYVPAEATDRVITNTLSKGVFTISASKTMYGAFLCGGGTDADTKSDTAGGGILFASSQFASPKEVVDNDVLMISCSITLADI